MKSNNRKKTISFLITATAIIAAVTVINIFFYSKLDKSSYKADFSSELCDRNSVQIPEARRNGIQPPKTRSDIDHDKLVKISSCSLYDVASLDYSVPYLTEDAVKTLEKIGEAFQDSLSAHFLQKHRIVVTSVLRTKEDITKLRKVNGNASKESAHNYATTFDISYVRFSKTGLIGLPANNAHLKHILGQVLVDLRREGVCYALYEVNQPCFHITSRR